MIFEDLQDRYGPYAAEMVRQSLTLKEFEDFEIEELVAHFELKAAHLYQEYRSRRDDPLSHNRPAAETEEYLNVLRRRWQEAEEMAHLVLNAETTAREEEMAAASRAS